MLLSVLMPAYNERYTIRECVRRVLAAPLPAGVELELVIVDDRSSDGTAEIVRELAEAGTGTVAAFFHGENRGKGASIRTAVAAAKGDILLIQDADLEYDPRDYPALLQPILDGDADVVYGSRFLSHGRKRALFFWHEVGNRALTTLSNVFTNLNLTDMETCYKAARAPFLKHLPIRCDRFGIEPELTAKFAKQKCRIYEVPIRYMGRTYEEGKKIGLRDALQAVGVILRFWLVDDLYGPDRVGRAILNQLSQTLRFNRWMAETIKPHVGHRVLEIGAGIGNMSAWLCQRDLYVVSDLDEDACAFLRRRFVNRPNILVRKLDISEKKDFEALDGPIDTVICLNVLEHVKDDARALANMREALEPGGRLILLVPQIPFLFGSLDEALGHERRYRPRELRALLEGTGFKVSAEFDFNRISTPAWLLNGRLLRRKAFGAVQLKIFDSLIWLFRRIDRFLPWPGQSVVFVAERRTKRRN